MAAKTVLRWLSTLGLYAFAVACTVLASSVAKRHVATLQHFQGTVLPAALALPDIERRIGVLKQQVEAADLQRALAGGALEERLRAFTVPGELSHERIVGVVDAASAVLEEAGVLQERSAVAIGAPRDAVPVQEGAAQTVRLVPVTVRYRMAIDGVPQALLLFDAVGAPTVGDILDVRDALLLLTLSEKENPAAVTGLEQFFDTDLLAYALEPRATVDNLLKSFTSEAFTSALEAALQQERMRQVRGVLSGPFGAKLQEGGLWPPPALFFEKLRRVREQDGSVSAEFTFLTPVRGEVR